ncbi:MAG: class I SAM-dependent methyltransferase [Caldilineaceae bacterium]
MMDEFYKKFYHLAPQSGVHARFCERSFGHNLCQHGFADMAQLDAAITALQLTPHHHLLDLGCGNGMIAEYISDKTGAHVTGLDYMPEAIRQATVRTANKADRLNFLVGDINALDLRPASFDAILSIDTIYFSNDYTITIHQLKEALRPAGQMAFFYSYGLEPGMTIEDFPRETLEAAQTPLVKALRANDLNVTTLDLTADDYRLAQLRKQVLTELQPAFAAEDLMFIYENRMGEATGISRSIEMGLHRRYLVVGY